MDLGSIVVIVKAIVSKKLEWHYVFHAFTLSVTWNCLLIKRTAAIISLVTWSTIETGKINE